MFYCPSDFTVYIGGRGVWEEYIDVYGDMSLPVSLASVGMPRFEHIENNAILARSFSPMSGHQRRLLEDSIHSSHKLAMHRFFARHTDA